MNHLILTRRPDLMMINWGKMDFIVPADHRVKIKENEKIDI